MANVFAVVTWQFLFFLTILPFCHILIVFTRGITPRIGPDERLFPRNLLRNDKLINEHRVKLAEKMMGKFQGLTNMKNDVEIRIVASNRGGSYLFQTAAFLIEQQPVASYNLSICNVESEFFEDLKRTKLPVETVGNGVNLANKELNSTLRKENEDYWKCLGLKSNQRYILLIEDDSIVISQFSQLLESLVKTLDSEQTIDYVKLYHPNHLRKLPAYFLIGTFSILVSHYICRMFRTYPLILFLLLSVSISFDLAKLGPQFPAEFRYHLTHSAYISYSESCCTVAVIFRSESVHRMIEYFNGTSAFSGHAKDHILDESPFTGRQSDLNYVSHIGSFSSVRQRAVILADLRDV